MDRRLFYDSLSIIQVAYCLLYYRMIRFCEFKNGEEAVMTYLKALFWHEHGLRKTAKIISQDRVFRRRFEPRTSRIQLGRMDLQKALVTWWLTIWCVSCSESLSGPVARLALGFNTRPLLQSRIRCSYPRGTELASPENLRWNSTQTAWPVSLPCCALLRAKCCNHVHGYM
jgi:hypothetical protein